MSVCRTALFCSVPGKFVGIAVGIGCKKSGTGWDLNGFAFKTELLFAFKQMSEVML